MTSRDAGLQPERTELAWRRTCLAIAVGSLVAIRLVPHALGHPAWALVGVAGLLVVAWLWSALRARSHAFTAALATTPHDADTTLDGRLPLILACVVVLAGLLALLVIVAV